MGEVYRARDTKLSRDVAIKVLPENVATDPERLARFHREAQVLASLNHPNIAHIYGFEDADGTHALVMELVEGSTLADRIAQGPIPLNEALPIARQIAEALETAHEQGIIHRDLKPANIKVREDGTVKVLDFGLAKLVDSVSTAQSVSLTASPTITTPAMMTGVGVILGTAAYMSPEQAKGRPADKRTDIWAFGCVLYEMLTGTRAFEGEDVGDTLASVLKGEPDWSRIPATTPSNVRTALDLCLAKDPKQRLRDVGDLQLALQGRFESTASASELVRARRTRAWIGWTAAGILAVAWLLTLFLRSTPLPSLDAHVIRATIEPPPGTHLIDSGGNAGAVRVSPDGSHLVFSAGPTSPGKLWLRSLDSTEARLLADEAAFPFWSPDSRFVAFSARGRLMKVDIATGALTSICEVPGALRGGSWNQTDDIIFGINGDGRIYRVQAGGGTPHVLSTPDRGRRDIAYVYPEFLPDGRHYLFSLTSLDLKRRGIYVGALASSDFKFIVNSRWNAEYAGGHLLYFGFDSSALLAQPFDLNRLELMGIPRRLVDQIGVTGPGVAVGNHANFSVSNSGSLAYKAATVPMSQMTWLDTSGNVIGTVGPAGWYANLVMSPDGTRVAIDRWDPQRAEAHVWVFDLDRGTGVPLRTGRGSDLSAAWSADGNEIAFLGTFEDSVSLYRKNLKTGVQERLTTPQFINYPTAWSPQGTLVLTNNGTGDDLDLGTLSVEDKAIRPLVSAPGPQYQGRLSPDGKLLAYGSAESGRQEVYVQPISSPGARTIVSTTGGGMPQWSGNGRTLFFIDQDSLSSVEVVMGGDDRLRVGIPKALFPFKTSALVGSSFSIPFQSLYGVTPDGRRFLRQISTDDEATERITVIVNWPALLKDK
jgi:serine/threonine protein kinase